MTMTKLTIAHISDLHAGSPYFVPSLMDRVVIEINELKPDLVLCTGDLTEMGFRQDYLVAKEYLERIECPQLVVIPGNHDARNVGYVHFEELVGPRWQTPAGGRCDDRRRRLHRAGPRPRPDRPCALRVAQEKFSAPAGFRIFMLHHHLLPVPGTGRERNIVYDAGDLLEVLQECGVNMVLGGHKHVPYAWRLERLFVINAGTCSSLRLRGNTKACYNIVRIDGDHVEVVRNPVPRQRDACSTSCRPQRLREVHPSRPGGGPAIAAKLPRAVVVIDGEHYPPVVAAALAGCGDATRSSAGCSPAAARSCAAALSPRRGSRPSSGCRGSMPSTRGAMEVAVVLDAVRAVIAGTGAEALVDLSDEPVIGYRERFLLMSAALAEGARYVAADTELWPQEFAAVTAMPALGVIGTGKRVGKTAVSGWLARRLEARLRATAAWSCVAMGRGGPPGAGADRPAATGSARPICSPPRARGRHAASDCYEDAVLAGVTAMGCRRCGGGLAGAAVRRQRARRRCRCWSERRGPWPLFEGSGSVVPPVRVRRDAVRGRRLAAGRYVTGYLGTYRLLLSDLLVLTSASRRFADGRRGRGVSSAAARGAAGTEVVPTVFRPRPAQPVRGRRVAFFTTRRGGPRRGSAATRRGLRRRGDVLLVRPRRRPALAAAVARAAREADVFLTEIKAAAVDVVAEGAAAARPRARVLRQRAAWRWPATWRHRRRLAALAAERFAARSAEAVRGREGV